MTARPNVDEIESRAKAAAEGPWEVHHRLPGCVVQSKPHRDGQPWRRVVTDTTREDAAFIADARTDVPALCAYVRELEARLAMTDDGCDSCGGDGYHCDPWGQKFACVCRWPWWQRLWSRIRSWR